MLHNPCIIVVYVESAQNRRKIAAKPSKIAAKSSKIATKTPKIAAKPSKIAAKSLKIVAESLNFFVYLDATACKASELLMRRCLSS